MLMSDDAYLNPDSDPFKPPQVPVLVHCLHCHREYDSYLIEWRLEQDRDGKKMGFWCCPTPRCDGRGFGFDIHPVDPEFSDDDDGESWKDDDEFDPSEFNPAAFDPEGAIPGVPFDAEEELEEILKEVEEKGDAPVEEDDEEEWEGDKPF